MSSYYPSSYEVNTIKLFETNIISKLKVSLPVIKDNNKLSISLSETSLIDLELLDIKSTYLEGIPRRIKNDF